MRSPYSGGMGRGWWSVLAVILSAEASVWISVGGGECSHIELRMWFVLQRDSRWTPGLYFPAGGNRACRTSTLTVYFDPNLTKINLILAQPRGVWIGLHQGNRNKNRPADWFQRACFRFSCSLLIIHVGLSLAPSALSLVCHVRVAPPKLNRVLTFYKGKTCSL